MKMILGKKIGMTRVYDKTGRIIPVTLILAGPCRVIRIKTSKTDGYLGIQIGFDKKKHITKPERGHLDRLDKNLPNFKYLRELRVEREEDLAEFKEKQEIKVSDFQEDQLVKVSGTSKGRGFAGTMKRHGFHGQSATHGHKHDLRKPGSIGSQDLQRVRKGLRMAGHMGDEKVTYKNAKIIKIDKEKNLMALAGQVPGARNGLLTIKSLNH